MPVATEPIRFALVGCGRIAQTHIEAFDLFDDATITAVVEKRPGAAEAAAEQLGCPSFSDAFDERVLDLVDAVLICVPPSDHHSIAKYFLEHGKHVYCEKPFTLTSGEAEELVVLANEREQALMMASKFRYVDDIVKARAIIESGILGDIVLYENTFTGKLSMAERWNATPEVSGGGVLIDNGSHSVDIARYLLGPITEVHAHAWQSGQNLGVEDTAQMTLRTESGAVGIVGLSWSINKESPYYIHVYGRQGTLLVGWQGSRYRQDGNSDWVDFGRGYGKVQAFEHQLVNFVQTIRKEAQPLIRPADALASVQVIEAAYASARSNDWVECPRSL